MSDRLRLWRIAVEWRLQLAWWWWKKLRNPGWEPERDYPARPLGDFMLKLLEQEPELELDEEEEEEPMMVIRSVEDRLRAAGVPAADVELVEQLIRLEEGSPDLGGLSDWALRTYARAAMAVISEARSGVTRHLTTELDSELDSQGWQRGL